MISPRLTAEEALTIQHKLMSWWVTDRGISFADAFAESVALGEDDPMGGWDQLKNGEFVKNEALALKLAPTYLVLDEMCQLVEHASLSIPKQPFRSEDFPSELGFAWFNKPMYTVDRKKKRLNIAAVCWYPISITLPEGPADESVRAGGLWISFYSDIYDPQDQIINELTDDQKSQIRSSSFRLCLLHGLPILLDGEGVTEMGNSIHINGHLNQDFFLSGYDEHPAGPVVNPMRYMLAFWTLIRQKLSITETVGPGNRAAWKRVERLGLTKPSEINVVTLRRVYEHRQKTGENPSAEWSHRWIVSGHWRNQWYPSIQEHRQIWIDPYEKGPEGTDLILKPKVIRWAR